MAVATKKKDDPILALVKERMETRSLTRYALAKESGANLDMLYRWFAGKRSPRIDEIMPVLTYFGMKIS